MKYLLISDNVIHHPMWRPTSHMQLIHRWATSGKIIRGTQAPSVSTLVSPPVWNL